MAVVGVIYGSVQGTLPTNFANVVTAPFGGTAGSGLFAAVVATVFAYAKVAASEMEVAQTTIVTAIVG